MSAVEPAAPAAKGMDAARWREVRQRFEQALELDEAGRRALLAGIADEGVRADVERLLATRERTAPIDGSAAALAALAAPAWVDPHATRDWNAEQLGRRCGAYRLERLLGAGGMGTVYVARRVDGHFDQVVAIKLVLAAHDGLRERFAKERKILAALQHPNIGQLFDGGESEDGVPYFAMEYVDGAPITDYCRERVPDAAGRVRLLLRVAGALSHAHRSLVIHRDIKPSNILVTRDGHPKLLDFGIAKLLGEDVLEGLTAQRIGPMTPEYAAPEQFRGAPITAATDVYQFGVLLYRLIAARWPYDADPLDLFSWGRAVLEQEPVPLARAWARTGSGPDGARDRPRDAVSELSREQARDLDAIARRALAKDPFARYGSVDALAADLAAFLDERPVAARRGGTSYVLSRFVARHKVAVAAASAAMLGLVGLTTYAVQQARSARHEAERARAAVRFVNEVFRAADPANARGGRMSAEQMLDTAASKVEPMLAEHPDLRGPVTSMMANIYLEMGANARAMPLFQRALADLRADPSTPSLLLGATLVGAGYASERTGHLDQAQRLLAEAEPLVRGDTLDALQVRDNLLDARAMIARNEGDAELAERTSRASLANAERAEPGGSGPLHVKALVRLARALKDRGKFDEAEASTRRGYAMARQLFGDEDYRTLQARQTLGWVLGGKGEYAAALSELEPVGERFKAMFGERSTDYATNLYDRALVYQWRGDYERAYAAFIGAAEGYADAASARSSQRGWALWSAANSARSLGRDEQALELLRQAELAWSESMGARARNRGSLYYSFAELLAKLGRYEEADVYADRMLSIFRETDPDSDTLSDGLELTGGIASARGDEARAKAFYAEALQLARRRAPQESDRIERLSRASEPKASKAPP